MQVKDSAGKALLHMRSRTLIDQSKLGAVAGYGFVTRRPVRFVLVAMLIHGIINYLIFPLQMGAFSVELFYVTIGAMTAAAFVWMLVRSVERHSRPG